MRILNRDSRCASWITIRNTVFWTVCTPNHVEIRDLRCASQITVQRCFRVTHLKSRISTWFGIHTVQNTVFRIVIQDAHLESRFKIRTLPSCENSLDEGFHDIDRCKWGFAFTPRFRTISTNLSKRWAWMGPFQGHHQEIICSVTADPRSLDLFYPYENAT